LRIKNLEELDLVLKAIKGKNASEYGLQDILVRNGITELPSVGFNSLEVYKNDIIPHSSQGKIQCIQNWRNVYGRIGISGGFGPTYIDFGFTIGDGSGLIVNWNSTLEGNTFMISLGKNDFRNGGYASASNGYTYTGTYHFTIKLVLFLEGVGEIMTYENKKVDIRVEGCSGVVTYNIVEE